MKPPVAKTLISIIEIIVNRILLFLYFLFLLYISLFDGRLLLLPVLWPERPLFLRARALARSSALALLELMSWIARSRSIRLDLE